MQGPATPCKCTDTNIERRNYTGKQKRVILCVAKKQFFPKIKDIVKEEDRNAFLIISNASDIYGEGFKDHFAEEF